MKSIIKNLTADQREALITLAEECSSYTEACAQARDKLGIKLSVSTLCRLYTTHRIADDADTRAEYATAAGVAVTDLMQLTENQLQLRLLELASRPNPGASDLRALFQIITRLRALVLSERRVVVAERRIALAEKRDHRECPPQPAQTHSPVTALELTRFVKNKLGKSTEEIDAEIARQAAANNQAAPVQPDPAADKNRRIALWTKKLIGREITLGDELLSDPFFTHGPGAPSPQVQDQHQDAP